MIDRLKTRWWNSIVFRSLVGLTLVTVVLGFASVLFIREFVAARVHEEAVQRLGELLDTVESTASVAVFANDELLALEVGQGLMRNSEVLRVRIVSQETELASIGLPPKAEMAGKTIKRTLRSPFNGKQQIGEIQLDADWGVVVRRVRGVTRTVTMILHAQLLMLVLFSAALVYLLVVRPIKATSDNLHRLAAAGAGGVRLGVPAGHESTEIGRLVGDVTDLTGRLVHTLDQERELRRQQEVAQRMYQDLFDHAASGIFIANAEGRLISFNPAFLGLTWIPRGTPGQQRHLTEPGWARPDTLLGMLARSALQHVSCGDDFLLNGRRGGQRWLNVSLMPLGDGSVQGTVTDVTERKLEEMSARRLAVTDSLTGFANRDGLLQAFVALDARPQAPFAVVMVDMDGFKQINDAMGFAVGDQVLLKVAGRIRRASEKSDFCARIGGDEFCVVIPAVQDRLAVEARVVALRSLLCEPYLLESVESGSVSISASLGVALYPQDGEEMSQLLRSAELALNSVRESGAGALGGGVGFFNPDLQVAVEHRRRLEDDLRLAVNARELRLVFQPIIDLKRGCLAGAEALLRWQHVERGFISPDEFIPLAERIGLIGEMGRLVLDEACRQVAEWRHEGLDIYVSINVFVRQIPFELPPEMILDALARHALPVEAMVIEITEGVLMSDVAIAQQWIDELRTSGLRVYLDDFGTGYSSLSYLKRFPMDAIKVDKSFVMDISANNSGRALVDAIVTMAGSLGLNVVAEGVEDAEQFALLREMGCGFGQGYFFSRPVPAADFLATARHINAHRRESDKPPPVV